MIYYFQSRQILAWLQQSKMQGWTSYFKFKINKNLKINKSIPKTYFQVGLIFYLRVQL